VPPAVALLGPPGSGKGTQATRLRDQLGFAPLSTGDLLRAARAAGTELGRRAAEYMDRGDLVPDELIVAMARDAIASLDGTPILLDGFPRTVAQADALARVLRDRARELTAAVLIDVPDDVVVERISGRRQGRQDDRPETVRERLRVYHRETEPLVAYYDERGLLRRVDGAGDPDAVAAGVRDALDGAR
jgi:adenylate kinase